jgi:hypothetical protein
LVGMLTQKHREKTAHDTIRTKKQQVMSSAILVAWLLNMSASKDWRCVYCIYAC